MSKIKGTLIVQMFHIKQLNAMLGFVNIQQVSDVDFERRTVRFHYCSSAAEFIAHGIQDCLECFGLLCMSCSCEVDSFACYQINCREPCRVDDVHSLEPCSVVSVFVDVKAV